MDIDVAVGIDLPGALLGQPGATLTDLTDTGKGAIRSADIGHFLFPLA
jgi:hypothetical protein